MPEPINFTPYAPPYTPVDRDEAASGPVCAPLQSLPQPEDAHSSAGAEGRSMLVESYRAQGHGGAGDAPTGASSAKSCLAPLLGAVGSCGVLAGSQGTAAIVLGSSCVASTLALIDCWAEDKRGDAR